MYHVNMHIRSDQPADYRDPEDVAERAIICEFSRTLSIAFTPLNNRRGSSRRAGKR